MDEAVKKAIEKLLGISLPQIFLFVALWAGYQYHYEWLRRHWLLVAILALLYEATALIAIFAGKVWAQELETEAVKATADWLRAILRKFAPGFRRRYNQQVIRDHEIFNVRGLGLIAAHTLKLEQVFVDLKVSTTSNPSHFNFDPVTARRLTQTRSVWDFLRSSLDHSNAAVALAIVGPPGSGGLVLERESGRWSFAHLTFQEYLTSAWWSSGKAAPRNWRDLVERSWWHETLRLYAAQDDATPLLQACLAANSAAALTLAAEIVEEGREIDEDVRRGVEERVNLALESDDPDLRRVGVEVLLYRRLKLLARIDERREIDPAYLTCAEYQLFLDEMRAQGKYRQPDHWSEFSFTKGQSREPIRGMRADDAVAFCEWLTDRQGGDVKYCLPALDEAIQHPAAGADVNGNGSLAAWCGADGKFSLTRLPDSDEQKIKQIVSKLSVLTLRHNFDLGLSSVLAPALDPARALALDHALALALDLNLGQTSALALGQALAFACARAHRLDHSIAYAVDSDFEGAFALDHAGARARILTRDLARYFERDSDRRRSLVRPLEVWSNCIQEITSALEGGGDIARARDAVGELPGMLEANSPPARVVTLIDDQLRIASANDHLSLRHAWQEYATHLLEDASEGLPKLPPDLLRSVGWQDFQEAAGGAYFPKALLDAYWWLKIALARADGRLPAWEGIRIVRERNSSPS